MRQEGQLRLILFILAATTNVKSRTFSRTTWCEHKGQNLGTYSSGTNKYITLEQAQTQCLERDDCGGITYDPDSDMYTLRQGETPISGASNEISWTRCTVESTVEKLEISSVEVSLSSSYIGEYKMANGDKMIDGDTSTSGIVYLEEFILSVTFSLELKLKDKAEVHAVIINGPMGGAESSLTLQGKTTYVDTTGSWSITDHQKCGQMPETNPATLQCSQPTEGDEVSFYISRRVHGIEQFTLEVNEIEVYGKVLPKKALSAGIIVLIVIGVLAGLAAIAGLIFLKKKNFFAAQTNEK